MAGPQDRIHQLIEATLEQSDKRTELKWHLAALEQELVGRGETTYTPPDRRSPDAIKQFLLAHLEMSMETAYRLLTQISESNVKLVCEALGISSTGRKGELIQRLTSEIEAESHGSSKHERELLEKLRELGGKAGKGRLQRALGWNDDKRFESNLSSLEQRGAIRIGPGRGGTVHLVSGEWLGDEERKFLDVLRNQSEGRLSNPKLQQKLGWDEKRYFDVRERLLDKNLIDLGRGRGGTVILLEVSEAEGDEERQADGEQSEGKDDRKQKEAVLYDRVMNALSEPQRWRDSIWQGEQDYAHPKKEDVWVVKTAFMTRAKIEPVEGDDGKLESRWRGIYTVPDVSIVALYEHWFMAGPSLMIYTFEIKPKGEFDIRGVYEANGHQRRANASFVIYEVEDPDTRNEKEYARNLGPIKDLARALGVGVITADDCGDVGTWTLEVPPRRRSLPAFATHNFIHAFMDERLSEIRGRVDPRREDPEDSEAKAQDKS